MKILGINIRPITYATFDKVGHFYNSLAAVIIGNLFFVAYRFFEVDTLFGKYLMKAQMNEASVFIASKFIAVVVIFTMLLIAVNRDRFKYPRAAEILGFVITMFINVYFWDVWDITYHETIETVGGKQIVVDRYINNYPELLFKWGISIITSAFDVAFAHLFIRKWQQQQRRSQVEQSLSALERSVKDQRAELSKVEAKVSEEQAELEAIQAKVKQIAAEIKRRTCSTCDREFSTVNAMNAHKPHCKGK